MVSEVMDLIDKRTGLTELIYGLSGRQLRSATEANVKSENMAILPDEMASRTEDWLSDVARNEMMAARWMLGPQDVQQALGPAAAMVWQNQIMTSDVDRVVRDFDYRIEAGTARKPNKNTRIQNLNEFGKVGMGVFQSLLQSGMPQPFNAFMKAWGDANDMDVDEFMIQFPQPDPNQPQPPSEEELKAQALQQEMQMDVAKFQQEQQQDAAEFEHQKKVDKHELSHMKEKGQLELEFMKQKNKAAKETKDG